jgi:hypothetical protein
MTVWTGPFRTVEAREVVNRVVDQPLSGRPAFVERVLRLASEGSTSQGRGAFPDEVVACAAIVAASLPTGRYLAYWGADLLPEPVPALAPLAYHTLVQVARANGTWSRGRTAGSGDHASTTVGNIAEALAAAMTPERRRMLVRCAGPVELFETLSHLRPRDCDFLIYEIDTAAVAGPVLDRLSITQRLMVGVAAAPILAGAVDAALAADPWALRLVDYLKCDFPPERPVPMLESRWLTPLGELAQGSPGQQVTHGLFPNTVTKLARLALAHSRYYPAATVIDAVEHAYDPGRAYHAHEALACALVCPDVDATPFVDRYVRNPVRRPGWRARRKRNRLVAWAVDNGYLVPDEGHRAAPRERRMVSDGEPGQRQR